MRFSKMLICSAACLALTGCETLEQSETAGRIGGAVLGAAVVGLAVADQSGTTSGIVAGAGAAVLGGWAGGRVARQIYQKDHEARGIAYRRAMDKYAQSGWRNPDTGSYGTIQRTSTSWVVGDETCANFRETYNPAGEPYAPQRTTTCLSARGWRVV